MSGFSKSYLIDYLLLHQTLWTIQYHELVIECFDVELAIAEKRPIGNVPRVCFSSQWGRGLLSGPNPKLETNAYL